MVRRTRPNKGGRIAVSCLQKTPGGTVASIVPTLGVILAYVLSGELASWVAGNVTAHLVFYGPTRQFELDPAFRAMWEQAPLWLGAALALAATKRLTRSSYEVRACVFLALWSASILLCQIFLRIASDHYFLQFLPPLSLLTGLLIGRGILATIPTQTIRLRLLVV